VRLVLEDGVKPNSEEHANLIIRIESSGNPMREPEDQLKFTI